MKVPLMKDQVSSITAIGLSAAMVSGKESTPPTVKVAIQKGDFYEPRSTYYVH